MQLRTTSKNNHRHKKVLLETYGQHTRNTESKNPELSKRFKVLSKYCSEKHMKLRRINRSINYGNCNLNVRTRKYIDLTGINKYW